MTKRHTLGRHLTAARAALAALTLLTLCAAHALAQKEAPATVTGRVTDGERGVAGVAVVVMSSDPSQRFRPVARARTDAEGHYRVTGVPPGRYVITPVAPAYVIQDLSNFPPGKPLTLSAGDSVEDTDFRVVRGGVVTGRVTDSDGNPVVAESIQVAPADSTNGEMRTPPIFMADQRDRSTDDRGVYRIYGLQPGHYRVSVGSDGRTFRAPGSKYYRRTFYPSASEESQAKIVEVTAGGVSEDVDITLGAPERTFRISGRFVMADTNQPVPVTSFGYGMLDPNSRQFLGDYSGGAANARGEFQATGLAPGRYKVFAYPSPIEAVEWYSDSTNFEITDSDVSGIVVKLRRGSTVSGVVALEGVSDRAAVARILSGVRVYGFAERSGGDGDPGSYVRPVTLAPDGSFRMTGVRPGMIRLNINSELKGLSFSRLEVGGVVQREGGVQVTEGAQVTGVRLVLVYGSAVLRGQLNFPGGGVPPQGTRMIVIVRRIGSPDDHWSKGTEADTRGRFQLEGLAAGEYEVQARAFSTNGRGPALMSEAQRISIGEGGDVNISVTLAPSPNMSAPPAGRP
jgi:protocatechuate 3,4-dioxygenase beta subunit